MRHNRIKKLYEEHRDRLYTYALSLTKCQASAEDAVHTALCKLLSAPRLPLKLKPYAYRCVRNAAIDDWRKNAAQIDNPTDTQQAATSPAHTLAEHDLAALLNLLAPDEREIVELKALHGFTFREIAAIRKSSLNTIASRYRRGLQKLRNTYAEESYEQARSKTA